MRSFLLLGSNCIRLGSYNNYHHHHRHRQRQFQRHRVISEDSNIIRGFHGGGYEECRLLGYKPPVLTSEEAHYVSASEPGR
jgi:hypothetical protein